jgi:hypothetical protein
MTPDPIARRRDIGVHLKAAGDPAAAGNDFARTGRFGGSSAVTARFQYSLAWPLTGVATAVQPIHFHTPVRFGRRRSDQYGRLLLTDGWLTFRGSRDLSVAWTEVTSVQRAGSDLLVTIEDQPEVLRFACHSEQDAARGELIAERLRQIGLAAPAL